MSPPSEAPEFVSHPRTARLIEEAGAYPPMRTAVVYPGNAGSLEAALWAQSHGLLEPVLVGPATRIAAIARAEGLNLDACELIDTPDDPHAAAAAAVELARTGAVAALMKGSLHTDELLAAVVRKSGGLRQPGRGRRLSHVFWFDIPGFPRPIMATDCVVNIAPSLITKRDIVQNAFELAHALGYTSPKLAIVSAVETVNPAIPSTVEAAGLRAMVERGEITGGIVDGPFGFDAAVSPEAARIKAIASPVAGAADILLLPNLEAGNMIYKSFVYMAHADCAGIVLGATVPVILTSRADSVASRIASCALAAIWSAAHPVSGAAG